MRLLPLSAFPLLAFLALLHLGQARQGNKPRDKLQLRAKPRAQEVSTDISEEPLSNSWISECPSKGLLLSFVASSQLTAPTHKKVTPLSFQFSLLDSHLKCQQ